MKAQHTTHYSTYLVPSNRHTANTELCFTVTTGVA